MRLLNFPTAALAMFRYDITH